MKPQTFPTGQARSTRLLASLVLLALATAPLQAVPRETATVESAAEVLRLFSANRHKGIPLALLREARAIAIIPQVVKGGVMVDRRFGRGVLLVREANGTWSHPLFVTLEGGGVGLAIGVEATDLVLVFKTRTSVEKMLQGKGRITLGADVAVAAGPLGRQAEAGTDAALNAEIFSYSRSRGLFVGLSLEGAALAADCAATDAYYRTPPPATPVPVPPPDERLRMKLTTISAPPPPIMVPPPGLVPR